MKLTLGALSVLFISLDAIVLKAVPDIINIGHTSNASIVCQGRHDPYNLASISWLRIDKLDSSGSWRLSAQLVQGSSGVQLDFPLAIGKGLITNATNYFLDVTWSLARNETLGTYRCVVSGKDFNGTKKEFSSDMVSVIEYRTDNIGLLHIIEAREQFYFQTIQKIQNNFHHQLQNAVSEMEINFQQKLNLLNKNIVNELNSSASAQASISDLLFEEQKNWTEQADKQLKFAMEDWTLQHWPEGRYGLAKPQSGCPGNYGPVWQEGYRKHQTESTSTANKDSVSNNTHLAKPILETNGSNHFVYQHFCMMNSESHGPLWPNGSYCITMLSGDYGICPRGFEGVSIHFSDEGNGTSTTFGYIPFGLYSNTSSRLYYCCRRDGKPSIEIHLPTTKPFYLYRRGGVCQKVAAMNVTNEFLRFDTEDYKNNDYFTNSHHPDVTLNNINLQLCYYEQK